MEPQTCANCHFAKEGGDDRAIVCHRFPPTVTRVGEGTMTTHFPIVSLEAWCGEWKKGRVNHTALSKSDRAIPRKLS